MNAILPNLFKRILVSSAILTVILGLAIVLGLSYGSSGSNLSRLIQSAISGEEIDPTLKAIIVRIRLPRVLMASLAGAALALGGLVFQALLRNPLAEPYILGISGGSAVGAILGILLGFSHIPGVGLMAFGGSTITLFLILLISSGQTVVRKDSLLLSGVMINAFCSSIIIFFISISRDSRLQNILFWIMGDLSLADMSHVFATAFVFIPYLLLVLWLSYTMNLLLTGEEMALSMGVNVKAVTLILLIATSFMIGAVVSYCGLLGFVGLVVPHLLRLILGSDHRLLAPVSALGGAIFLVLCDLLARWIPAQGEMPVGVVTAIIGAPLFIYLLRKSRK